MSKTKSPIPFILNEGIMCNLCRKRRSPYWGEMGPGLILQFSCWCSLIAPLLFPVALACSLFLQDLFLHQATMMKRAGSPGTEPQKWASE